MVVVEAIPVDVENEVVDVVAVAMVTGGNPKPKT